MLQNATGANSWGGQASDMSNQQQQWSGQAHSDSQRDGSSNEDYSDDYYETDEEDDDYAPLQMGAWGAQPTGDQADANAIQMPNWNDRPTDETPSLTFTTDGWKKLIDPTVVVKSGIGSGNLHRKGANYRPVDEQYILNQRLKIGSSPLPGSKKKSRGGKKKKAKAPPPPFPPSLAHRPVGKPVPSSHRPPLAQSAWGSQLASTPFWESGGAQASKYAPTPPAPSSKPPTQRPEQMRSPGGRLPPSKGANKWLTQALQENPVPSQQPIIQQQQQQQPTAAAASKWANQPLQEKIPAPAAPAPAASNWGQPVPENPTQYRQPPPKPMGSAASKYATQPSAPIQQQQPAQNQQQPAQDQPTAIHGTISLTGSAPITPPRKTIFQLNIELIPGVSAILPVYETDDYTVLVKEFGAKHHLTIAPEAEFTFAEKIKQMVAALKQQQQQQQ
ncbi:hypothetical protein BC941DRAFT_438909 [Chlamydoabsidia padenii]|nr:hypothetical protein BC941DRAFT_438909 [Chlamydoabsidia padenii]